MTSIYEIYLFSEIPSEIVVRLMELVQILIFNQSNINRLWNIIHR